MAMNFCSTKILLNSGPKESGGHRHLGWGECRNALTFQASSFDFIFGRFEIFFNVASLPGVTSVLFRLFSACCFILASWRRAPNLTWLTAA